LSVADEDAELVGEEAQMILDCVLGWCEVGFGGEVVEVDWVPEAEELHSRFADAHGPTHALDGDFFNAAGEFIVLDFAVVVVVAGVYHDNFLRNEMLNDVLGYERCEGILVLIALCKGD
jgi:hypothetical protein